MEFNLDLGLGVETNTTDVNVNEIYESFIIGGGPAAMTAAVYLMRKGIKTAIVAGKIGGQVGDTKGIENYMGYNYIEGDELVTKFSSQVRQFEIAFRENTFVENIRVEDGIKFIKLSDGIEYRAKTVIIAAGSKWRQLNVPGEDKLRGRGVCYCAICDGPFFKGLDIAVVGGGNSGVEAALDLSKMVKSIKVLEFADKLNADKVLVDKLLETPNIEAITSAQVVEILGDQGVSGIKYKDRVSGEEKIVEVEGVFVEIGLVPNSQFVEGLVELNKFKEIVVNKGCETTVEGIYACGDITDVPFKQIIIASGEGAKAALSACEYLNKH
ncbi:MAG: FAD-dependent oxidoreductase [Fusobacteriaceae bacterium]|nr:FAD-dependent oxidoreductase [Fusobacteriaceae bacterium]MBN2837511.1 FAD-dependent oxidoreductase [Fusobacteriaceae bacterium]